MPTRNATFSAVCPIIRPTTGSVSPFISPITGARKPGRNFATSISCWPSDFAAYHCDSHATIASENNNGARDSASVPPASTRSERCVSNCAMPESIDCMPDAQLLTHRSDLVLAGGTDALSRAPLLFSDAMVAWLSQWYAAKTLGQRAMLAAKFRPGFMGPVIGLMKGLTERGVG